MKRYLGFALSLIIAVGPASVAHAATLFSQTVTLSPGWNIVSTPRVLDSHAFSAEENSTNFDIYVLDASQTSGWATMAQLGQTEFAPLWGYFIDNKTGVAQTLTLNYKADTKPNERLFERSFSTPGWYSIGAANPSYAQTSGTTTTDKNNPNSILASLGSSYSTALDLTDGNFGSDQDSVAVAGSWKAATASDVNSLRDMRETKGYAIYLTSSGTALDGFQNSSEPECTDGIDNDNDGLVDYPSDPSCSSAYGNDESYNPPTQASLIVTNSSSVPSQSIAVNVPNQVFGGFETAVSNEPVTVQGIVLTLATSSTGTGLVSLASIVDENGSVVAGPVDAAGDGTRLTFSNSVTFPTGTHTYTVKGKVPTSFSNNGTVTLSTDPATWSSPLGQTTGTPASLPAGVVTMNPMTIRGPALAVSASTNPASQTIIAGGQNVTFANLQLDASQSGEDVRLSSVQVDVVATSTSLAALLSNCQIWDGSTSLTTGSNVKNTISAANGGSGTSNIFTLDNSLTITKGTVKTLAVSCSLSSSAASHATETVQMGVDTTVTPYNSSVTGVQSGQSFTPTVNATSYSGIMTIANSASVAVSVDSSSPSYAVSAAGTTGVTMGVVKLRASNENVNLTKLGLTLVNTVVGKTGAGSTATAAGDLTQVYLYSSGGTLLGTATFVGSNTTATTTLSTPLTLTRDTDTTVIIKADLASIGSANSGGVGDLIKVDPLNYEGTGVSSGNTVKGAATSGVAGNRMFKSYPTLALDTLGSTGVADGRLMHFKVTANSAGSVGIDKFTFSVSTTSTTVTNVNLYGFTDSSYSQAISGQGSGGLIGSQLNSIPSNAAFSISPTTNPVQVPAGTTYYFELRGSVAGVQTGSAVVTTLKGDAAYDAVASGYQVNTVAGLTSSNFIWSGNSMTTAASSDIDWSNGYSLPGLPAAGLIQTRVN